MTQNVQATDLTINRIKMRILILCSRNPYPIDSGGKRRIISISEALANAGHQIDLVYVSHEKHNHHAVDSNIFSYVRSAHLSKLNKLMNLTKNLWRLEPFQVSMFRSEKILREINSTKYDVVITHMVRLAWIANRLKGTKNILELTDSLALNYKRIRLKNITKLATFTVFKIEALLLRIYERKCVNVFDHTVVVSEIDKSFISEANSKIKVIPLSIERRKLTNVENKRKNIIFIGKLDYQPNEDALLYTLDHLMPEIFNFSNEITLYIVGNNVTDKVIRRVENLKNVKVCGFVADLETVMSTCFCSLALMQSGAGMQTKILDAMQYGVPVITTTIGYGGFDFIKQKEIIVVDEVADQILSIKKMFSDSVYQKQISQNGYQAVHDKYGIDQLKKVYLELVLNEIAH